MKSISKDNDVEKALREELSELCRITGHGSNLRIRWDPQQKSELAGEVRNDTVWIYIESKEDAIRTLRHEFLDWLVVQSLRPYERLINLQRVALNSIFKHLEDISYKEKEQLIDALVKLLDINTRQQNGEEGKPS